MKFLPIFLLSLFFAGSLTFVTPVRAQKASDEIYKQLGAAGGKEGGNLGTPRDPRYVVALIIKVLLTLVGTVMFALMVYAGYMWMTAGGNEEQVASAKTTIRNSVIGLIIVLSSYAITLAVTNIASMRDVGTGASGGAQPLENAIDNAIYGN